MTLKKTIQHLLYASQPSVPCFITIHEIKLELSSGKLKTRGPIGTFLPCDLEIKQMTLKNKKKNLSYGCRTSVPHFRPIPPFKLVINRKPSNWDQICHLSSPVTLKFNTWPWKTIGHLSYASRISVSSFIPIPLFKQELLSGNAKNGVKSALFGLCDLEIEWMTLQNSRAPPICL